MSIFNRSENETAYVGGGTKKGLTHPRGPVLQAAFSRISKAALIDMIGDAMDVMHSEGEWSMDDLLDFAEPRLRARQDRVPKDWQAGYLRRLPRPGEVAG